MLEKIININSNQPYKGKKKSGNFEKFLNKPQIEKVFGKDSISFSPGALYLSKINWQLKEIDYPAEEKVVVQFIIDEFEFTSEVDFVNFYTNNYQKYKVNKKKVDQWEKTKALVEFKVYKGQLMLEDNYSAFQPNAIRSIFKKISNSPMEIEDSHKYSDLLYGIEDDLVLEFQLITNHLYTFINKMGKYNIVNDYVFNLADEKPITLEKITAINVK